MFEDVVTLKVPLPNSVTAQIPFSPITIEVSEPEEVQLPVTINVQPLYADIFDSPDFVKVKQGDTLKYQWLQADVKLPPVVSKGDVYLNYELKANITLPSVKIHTEVIFDNHREFEGSSIVSNHWDVEAKVNVPIGVIADIKTPKIISDSLVGVPTNVTADIKLSRIKLNANVTVSRALFGNSTMGRLKSDGKAIVPNAIIAGSTMQIFKIANADCIVENADSDKPKTEYEIFVGRVFEGASVVPNRFKSEGYAKLERIIDCNIKLPAIVSKGYTKVPIVINSCTTMPAIVSQGLVGIPTRVYADITIPNRWHSDGYVDFVKRFEGHSRLPRIISKGLIAFPFKVDWGTTLPSIISKGELKLTNYINANIELPKFVSSGLISDRASGSLTNIVIGDGETLIIGNGFKIKEM